MPVQHLRAAARTAQPLTRGGARRSPYLCVELSDVHLRLGGRPVLRGVHWRIEPGQGWVLIGPNGAGKTQLMKILAGDVWPTADLSGRVHASAVRRYAWAGEWFDDPYGVKQEIAYIGAERQDRYEHYRWNQRVRAIVGTGVHRTEIPLDPLSRAERARVGRVLRGLGLERLASRRFLSLSYGERRLVLLARALAWRPRLLLLDELFDGLDTGNRDLAMRCLAQLSRSGLPWVLSTHRRDQMPAFATHVCRVERGLVDCRPLSAERPALADRHPHRSASPRRRSGGADLLVKLTKASVWRAGRRVLNNVSLELQRGQCWVVHGPNGSGKSSLIQALYGDLTVAAGGQIWRRGIEPGVPLELFKRTIGLVAPELQTAHPRYLGVGHVVASGLHASIGLADRPGARQRGLALRALRRFGALGLASRPLRALSYGQMRRVLFARAWVGTPDMLLLDEPYAGLDEGTRLALQARVLDAARRGVAIVLTTHHRNEWPAAATHELELTRGSVRYCGPVRWSRVARVGAR